MSYEAHTEESENGLCTLKIIQDEDAFNPRHEYDHIGHMVCFHSRYDLGDKYHYNDPKLPPPPKKYAKEVMQEEADGYTSCSLQELMESDYKDMTLLEAYEEKWSSSWYSEGKFEVEEAKVFAGHVVETDGVVLPLYLYDHSGITISTGRFSCPWDSGQVGFIYMTKAEIDEHFDGDAEKAKACLQSEVEEYDQYLTGDVYGCVIEDDNGDNIESCWGFFGLEYAIEEGRSMLKYQSEGLAEQRAKEEKESNEQEAEKWVEDTYRR